MVVFGNILNNKYIDKNYKKQKWNVPSNSKYCVLTSLLAGEVRANSYSCGPLHKDDQG